MSSNEISRRSAMGRMAAGLAVTTVASAGGTKPVSAQEASSSKPQYKGNVNHSACMWCYVPGRLEKEAFVKVCADLGLVGIDLVSPQDWDLVKSHGLIPTMVPGGGSIVDGTNDKANHARILEQFKTNIPAAAKAGIRNVITFSGSREGKSDEEGWENSLIVLKEAAKIAEDEGIIINMEILNSKVDHPDYQCDKTWWGVELCKRVGSPNFKLLYDIYHTQIMEGDIIRTIRDNIQYIGHFHTGGNPGRHEIDETQELYYPAIMKAIVELGYDGYVAQEFIPSQDRDPVESLRQAVELCDV